MRQKDEPNLVFEIEAGSGVPGLDDGIPKPVHRGTVGDVGGVGWSSATGEKGTELGAGVGDESPRVPTPREGTGGAIIREDGYFHRVEGA